MNDVFDKEVFKSVSEARMEQLKKMTYGKRLFKKKSQRNKQQSVYVKDSCTVQHESA